MSFPNLPNFSNEFPNFPNIASNFRIYQTKLGEDLFLGLTPNFPNNGGQFSEWGSIFRMSFLIFRMNFPNFKNIASNLRIYQPKLGGDLFLGLTSKFPNMGLYFLKFPNFPNEFFKSSSYNLAWKQNPLYPISGSF